LLLKTYCAIHDRGFVGYEKILISLSRNDYEPDICYFNKELAKDFHPKKMQFPAPDFVVEVLSESTEERDRGIKFEDYAFHGIAEYWIVDPEKQLVEQYIFEDKKYSLKMKSGTVLLESIVLENFKVPVQAVFNKEENLKTLSEIIKK
jgi:Uma2 family endonuclease